MTESNPSPRRRRRRPRRPGPLDQPEAAQPTSGRDVRSAPEADSGPAGAESQAGSAVPGRSGRDRLRKAERAETPAGQAKPRRRTGRSAEDQQARDSDRGWRDLLGNAPSQVGVSGALRARDVARPGPAELAAAERDLVIVRRQWKPPEETSR